MAAILINLNNLEVNILKAISNQELVLYYQPEFNLATSSFEGVEALLRWQHPEHGLLLPGQFLPLVQRKGLMHMIDRWVLPTACQQMKNWQTKAHLPSMRIAVNISNQGFTQPDLVDFILATLEKYELEPNCLELELNENIIIEENDTHIIATIKKLSAAGVQIALDDFGSGYADVSYFEKIPVDRIKIDKSYIDDINTNPQSAATVRAIIDLATQLNLQVLAEGIESLKQLQSVAEIKGVETQGFYFSEALPAHELEKFLVEMEEVKR